MIKLLKKEILGHGDQAALVPIHRLQNIRQDIENLKGRGGLSNFQQFILNDIYKLDVPETDFEVRSVIIVASPSPASVELGFTWNGKRIPMMLPASYLNKQKSSSRVENYLRVFLEPKDYHVHYAPRLPHKLLAVRSGLGAYGRNNSIFSIKWGITFFIAMRLG